MHVSAPTCKTSRVAFRSAHYRIILPFLLNSKLQWFAYVQYLLKPQMKYCGREGERRLYDACSLNHWCCIIEGGGVGRSEGGSWGFAGIKNPCSRGRRSQIKSGTRRMKQDDLCLFAPDLDVLPMEGKTLTPSQELSTFFPHWMFTIAHDQGVWKRLRRVCHHFHRMCWADPEHYSWLMLNLRIY